MHRQSLRALRRLVLAQRHSDHPDLAELARELGSAIRRDAAGLTALAACFRPGPALEHWPLRTRGWPDLRMQVVAWPAGHLSPLHDHATRWGLEISLHGALEVETWSRDPHTGEPLQTARHWLGPGDAVWFDADEPRLHRCRNLSRRESALSLHLYGGAPVQAEAYAPLAESGRQRQSRPTALGAALRG